MGKNFAPRISPVKWWVYIAEDQYIQFDAIKEEIIVTLDTICIDLGEHIRTVRQFKATKVGAGIEVTMQFGAVTTCPERIIQDAAALRDAAFSELAHPTWQWAERAEEVLKSK